MRTPQTPFSSEYLEQLGTQTEAIDMKDHVPTSQLHVYEDLEVVLVSSKHVIEQRGFALVFLVSKRTD
jgi:hypothetical protein